MFVLGSACAAPATANAIAPARAAFLITIALAFYFSFTALYLEQGVKVKPENLEDLVDQLNDLQVDVDQERTKVRVYCE